MAVTYDNLVNNSGTVQTTEGQKFGNPTELASAMNISPDQIDWQRIKPFSIEAPTVIDADTLQKSLVGKNLFQIGTDPTQYALQGNQLRGLRTPGEKTTAGLDNVAPTQISPDQADQLGFTTGSPLYDYANPNADVDPFERIAGLTAQMNQASGVTDLTKQVGEAQKGLTNAMNNAPSKEGLVTEGYKQLDPIQAEMDKLDMAIANKEGEIKQNLQSLEGKPMSMATITGAQAQYQKTANIELQTLYAQKDALSKKYERAASRISDIIDAKYSDSETQIKNRQTLLEMISDNLDRAQKQQADQQKLVLDQVFQQIQDKKQAEKEQKNQVLDLMQKYPQAGITLADTYESAIKKTAPYVNEQYELGMEKTRMEIQKLKAEAAEKVSTLSGLDKNTATRVDKITGQWDNEAIVKQYNTIAEGYSFAKSIKNDTTSPSDDQALIYAFAKAMDPNSVVREGEYATVQKYSQSWMESFGFDARRVVDNSQFLTSEARQNIKNTILKRFQASQSQYDNIYNEYSRRIDSLTGGSDGSTYLTDYSKANRPKSPDEYVQVHPEVYDKVKQMILDKMSDEDIMQVLQPSFSSVGGDTNQAQKIAQAIKQVESGGNYNAKGASGEGGAYQFMPSTWKSWAGQYLGNANAPMTAANQDKVATAKIQDLLSQGYNAQQIALIWNGGEPVVKKGVNSKGVAYDSGAYARSILNQLNG